MATLRATRLLAGTLISDAGISRNTIVCRDSDSQLSLRPFTHEMHSTPFIDCVALIVPTRLTPDHIKEIERISASGDTLAIYSYLFGHDLLASTANGVPISVGLQSIIIEI
ncbi:MAG: hypothetical protein K2J07_05040 [Muribaculaceae bacterium]|nr:hypothetical protein [Muribaculaceae bacterium]